MSTECLICTEKNCDYKTPCNHLFHEECVTGWIKDYNSCPICRKAIDETKPIKTVKVDTTEEDEKIAMNLVRQEEEEQEIARQFWRLKNQKDEETILATFLELEYFLMSNNQTENKNEK